MKRYSLCPISAILLAVCLLFCGQTPAETPKETGSTMNSDTETAAPALPIVRLRQLSAGIRRGRGG